MYATILKFCQDSQLKMGELFILCCLVPLGHGRSSWGPSGWGASANPKNLETSSVLQLDVVSGTPHGWRGEFTWQENHMTWSFFIVIQATCKSGNFLPKFLLVDLAESVDVPSGSMLKALPCHHWMVARPNSCITNATWNAKSWNHTIHVWHVRLYICHAKK